MNIFKLIASAFGFANARRNQMTVVYERLVRFLFWAVIPALIISYLLKNGVVWWNLSPWLGYIPYIIGLVMSLIFMVVIFQPDILMLVGVANWAQGRNLLPTDPAFKPWQKFTNTVWFTVAWINIPFMFIGGIPVNANPFAVFAILSAITIISLVSEKTIWRKVVVLSAVIILSVNLLTLISQPMWFWLTGYTVHFGATKTEVALTHLLDTMEQSKDEITQKRLDKIADRIKNHKAVSEEDNAFLLEQQDKATTLQKKLTGVTNELLEKAASLKKTTSAPQPDKPTTTKVVVQQTIVQVIKPAPIVQSPPPVTKPVIEVWNVRFRRHGPLLELNFQLTRDGDTITMLGSDGTKLVMTSADGNHYSGDMFVYDKYAGTCGVNLSGWGGDGWWEDIELITLLLKRLS